MVWIEYGIIVATIVLNDSLLLMSRPSYKIAYLYFLQGRKVINFYNSMVYDNCLFPNKTIWALETFGKQKRV